MLKYVLFNVVLLFVVSTFAAVPPYLKVCGRKNPKLDECILESVKFIEPKLRDGIPELDVPSTEPFVVKELILLKQPDFYAVAKDVAIYGLTKYEVKSLHVDLENKKIDLDLFFKDIKMNSKYHVDAKILVPVSGTGPLEIKTRDVSAKAILRYKLVNHKGKEYMYFHSMTTKLNLSNFDPQFEVTDGPDSPLGKAINTVANSNQDELLKAATPNIEKAITETVLELASKITKHFPYEELFPDHE